MSEFSPDWLTDDINQALAAIRGEHVAKKETTVLRLAEAIANGKSLTDVFRQPDTCVANIWYGYTTQRGKVKRGWKDDPAIARALELATERARWWVRVRGGRAVQEALDTLVDAMGDAARQYANVVRRGSVAFYAPDAKPGALPDTVIAATVKEVLDAGKYILSVNERTASKESTTLKLGDTLEDLINKAYGTGDDTDQDNQVE